MERKFKHLEFIQGVINRLSTNSFLLKGWSIVFVSALIAVSTKEGRVEYLFLACLPTIAFWGLDGYFLWQERVYRKLYDYVRVKAVSDIDFSMDTRAISDGFAGWFKSVFSKTLLIFHGILLSTLVIVMAIQLLERCKQ